jgi:predicted ABC-type ATPase
LLVPTVQAKAQLSLLFALNFLPFTHRAYIFDNSNHHHSWLAEITDGKVLEMKNDLMPEWFKKALLNKIPS